MIPSTQVNVYFILHSKNITELQISFVFSFQCSSQCFYSPFSFPACLTVVWKMKWKLFTYFSWIRHSFNWIFHLNRFSRITWNWWATLKWRTWPWFSLTTRGRAPLFETGKNICWWPVFPWWTRAKTKKCDKMCYDFRQLMKTTQ